MPWSLRERRAPRWRRAGAIDVLRALWIFIIFWGELGTFYASVAWCKWPDTSFAGLDAAQPATRIIIVSDPQVLDWKSYPGRWSFLTALTLFFVDLNLRKSWKAALRLRPQIVIFLGDMMDGGRYAKNPEEYAKYYSRFSTIFKLPSNILAYHIPGNHDVGLGYNQAFSSRARERYQKFYGALNQVLEVSNHSLVLIDSPGLVEEDYRRYSAQTDFNSWLPTAGGSIEFVQSIAQNPIQEPTILFSHIPLARPDGAYCGPRREKGTIHRGAGVGYQNLLGRETTQFLLESVRPSLIFSGDDHDACEYTHPFYSEATPNGAREVTVKAFSMAMGIEYPAFELLSLASPPVEPLHAEVQCVLPNQVSIYTQTYLPLFALSLLLLGFLHTFGSRRPAGYAMESSSPSRTLPSKTRNRTSPKSNQSSSPGVYSPSVRAKNIGANMVSSRAGSPVSSAQNTPFIDSEEFAMQQVNHSPEHAYPTPVTEAEFLDRHEGLPSPAAARPSLKHKNSSFLPYIANGNGSPRMGDLSAWYARFVGVFYYLTGRGRRKVREEPTSLAGRFLRDLWRAAWPPLVFAICLWTYLFWS